MSFTVAVVNVGSAPYVPTGVTANTPPGVVTRLALLINVLPSLVQLLVPLRNIWLENFLPNTSVRIKSSRKLSKELS